MTDHRYNRVTVSPFVEVVLVGIENILYTGIYLQVHRLVKFEIIGSLQTDIEEVLRIHRYRFFKESRTGSWGTSIEPVYVPERAIDNGFIGV